MRTDGVYCFESILTICKHHSLIIFSNAKGLELRLNQLLQTCRKNSENNLFDFSSCDTVINTWLFCQSMANNVYMD